MFPFDDVIMVSNNERQDELIVNRGFDFKCMIFKRVVVVTFMRIS